MKEVFRVEQRPSVYLQWGANLKTIPWHLEEDEVTSRSASKNIVFLKKQIFYNQDAWYWENHETMYTIVVPCSSVKIVNGPIIRAY